MVCYSNGPVNHILVYPRDYVDPLTLTLGLIDQLLGDNL